MDITFLPNDPDQVRVIAEWHQHEWGHLSERTVEDRIAEFEEQLDSSTIPLTLVAYDQGQPVGTTSLLVEDMHVHRDLTPWLASVYVLPAFRGRGIGSALCRRAVQEAERLGVETLYLYTPDQAPFYERMGWETVRRFPYHGIDVTLMNLRLAR